MRFLRLPPIFAAIAAILLTASCETARLVDEGGPTLWSSVSPRTAVLEAIGATLQMSVVDASGQPVSDPDLTWQAVEPNVLQVDGTGRVTAVAPGAARVVALASSRTDTAIVEVRQTVRTIAIAPSALSVQVGSSVQLTAFLSDANGHAITGRSITWTSASPSIATVNANGLVTTVAAGAAVINATSGNASGTATVTVTTAPPPPPPPPAAVATVTITPPAASVEVGSSVQLLATLRDASGAELTGRTVTWTTSSSPIATVSASGLVTAVA
ncbi:MAG TPA: Ig-like domain-containing protein, partial [Gemmatimonadaceae bacterium]|nr:Ig-like domain-containing protein [Gemmatimonadaceae bacterium]